MAWLLITALPAQAVPYVPAPRVGNSAEGNGFVEGPHPQTPAPRSFGIGGGGSGNGARARRERASSVWPGALGVALSRDELGNRVRQIDANDHTTAFEYDRLGREIKRLLPPVGTADPAFETKSYDDAGNLETRTDFAGRVTAYTYDVMNRLLARTAQCAPIPCAGAADASFTYTPSGRRETVTDARGVTEYEYDDRDRLQSLTYPDSRKLEYLYDANGNRTTLTATIPAVGGGSPTVLTTAYTYDDANRLDLVTDTAGRTYDHGYDLNGNRTSLAQPNGTLTEYVYNALNRLTNLSTTHAGLGTTIQSYGLTLGPAGNRERIDEGDGTSRIYTYDELYRLTSDTVTIGALNQYSKGFTYDDVGNRETQTTTIGPAGSSGGALVAGTLTYGYDDRDRLTTETLDANPATTYGWDVDGNLITKSGEATYEWDREMRMVRVTKTDGTVVEHAYDFDGVRVQTRTTPAGGSTSTTNFLVDTSGSLSHVVAETDATGALVAHYVRGDDLLAVMRPNGPGVWTSRFYHADHIGSVRRLTNEAGTVTDGYTYDAFGTLLAHTGTDPQPYAFTGEPYDPNIGFQYHRARWMDPRVGRFVSGDPWRGAEYDPPSLHRYMYTHSSPVNHTDRRGLFTDIKSMMAATGIALTLAALAVVSYNSAINGTQTTLRVDSTYWSLLYMVFTMAEIAIRKEVQEAWLATQMSAAAATALPIMVDHFHRWRKSDDFKRPGNHAAQFWGPSGPQHTPVQETGQWSLAGIRFTAYMGGDGGRIFQFVYSIGANAIPGRGQFRFRLDYLDFQQSPPSFQIHYHLYAGNVRIDHEKLY